MYSIPVDASTRRQINWYTVHFVKPRLHYYNRLSVRLYNRFDNRLYRVNKHPTGCQTVVKRVCQTGLTTGLTTVLNEQTVRSTQLSKRLYNPVWQPGLTTGLTVVLNEQHCSFNRLSNRVVQPVWQTRFDNRIERTDCSFNTVVKPVVHQTGLYNRFDNRMYTRYNRLSNRFDNGFDNEFDNRLYRVYKHLPGCQIGLTTGLTTSFIV